MIAAAGVCGCDPRHLEAGGYDAGCRVHDEISRTRAGGSWQCDQTRGEEPTMTDRTHYDPAVGELPYRADDAETCDYPGCGRTDTAPVVDYSGPAPVFVPVCPEHAGPVSE